MKRQHNYYIYIITNKNRTVFYTGVTNNLHRRLSEHKENAGHQSRSFAARYNVYYLLYFEHFTWIQKAIAREKEIKKWRREKKIALIRTSNPEMAFLDARAL